jgi:hypothetical protein
LKKVFFFLKNIYYVVEYCARLKINQMELGIKSLHLLWALQIHVNGFKFHTQSYGRFKKTMNNGVCVKGSCYDDNECDYYRMLEEVVRLKYLGSKCKVFMFKCHWYDTRRGIRMHRSNGLVEIKHTSRLYGNEDFVLAQQCQQVSNTCPPDNKSSEWWTIIKTTTRSRYNVDMSEFIEDDNNMKSFDVAQSDDISQPCRVLST